MIVRRMAAAAGLAGLMVLGSTGAAFAHDCYNTQKKPGSGGAVGSFNVATGEEIIYPSHGKSEPAFFEVIFPDGSSGFVFIHSAKGTDGVVAGAKNCDQKGLDSFSACFGG